MPATPGSVHLFAAIALVAASLLSLAASAGDTPDKPSAAVAEVLPRDTVVPRSTVVAAFPDVTVEAGVGPNETTVGDAAGYVEPFTGEGMAWALGGAASVAPLAVKAASGWSDSYRSEWRSLHARLVGSRQRWCRMAARVLRSPLLCQWLVRGLSVAPGIAGRFVRGLNRPPSFAAGAIK